MSTSSFWFTPRVGYKVMDRKTGRHVPPGGAKVPNTRYWLRKVAWGDGTKGAPPKPDAVAVKPKTKKKTKTKSEDS